MSGVDRKRFLCGGVGFSRVAASVLVVSVSAVAFAACSKNNTAGKSTASTLSSPATASTASPTSSDGTSPAAATACGGGAHAGQRGILQVFCGGSGDAKITVGSTSKELTGGTCSEQSGQFAVNFGAVTGPDYASGTPKPDYLGALVDDSSGTVNAFTISIDGVSSGVITNRTATVSADKRTATFNGKRLSDGTAVTVDVTC